MLMMEAILLASLFFFFNDTATTEIYTLSLHDALPICRRRRRRAHKLLLAVRDSYSRQWPFTGRHSRRAHCFGRSEEHTSELQSRQYLVCRLLLEKKKTHIHSLHIILYPPLCPAQLLLH